MRTYYILSWLSNILCYGKNSTASSCVGHFMGPSENPVENLYSVPDVAFGLFGWPPRVLLSSCPSHSYLGAVSQSNVTQTAFLSIHLGNGKLTTLAQEKAEVQVLPPCPTPALPLLQATQVVVRHSPLVFFKNFLGYCPGGSRTGPGVSAAQQGWGGVFQMMVFSSGKNSHFWVVVLRSISTPFLTGKGRGHHTGSNCYEFPFRNPP